MDLNTLFKQSLQSSAPEFKLLLLGDGNVGKTSFIGRYVLGCVEKRLISTVAATVHPLVFFTNHGPLKFQVWDTNGQEKNTFVRDSFYINAHCAIIMFDVTSSLSYQNLSYWHENIKRICGNIPVVICGNKVELEAERKVKVVDINFHKQHRIQYFEISALACHNFENPFLYLAKKLSNQKDLYFLEKPVLGPREVEFSPKTMDADCESETSTSPRQEEDIRSRGGSGESESSYHEKDSRRSDIHGEKMKDDGSEGPGDGISAYTEDS